MLVLSYQGCFKLAMLGGIHRGPYYIVQVPIDISLLGLMLWLGHACSSYDYKTHPRKNPLGDFVEKIMFITHKSLKSHRMLKVTVGSHGIGFRQGGRRT